MRVPAATGQVSVEGHLEEVAGRVDAVVVQRELLAEQGDSVPCLLQGHLSGLASPANMELAVHRAATLRVGGHKLADGTVRAMCILLELDLGHNYVILQHGATVGADSIATSIVHFYVGRAAVLALVTPRHVGSKLLFAIPRTIPGVLFTNLNSNECLAVVTVGYFKGSLANL